MAVSYDALFCCVLFLINSSTVQQYVWQYLSLVYT